MSRFRDWLFALLARTDKPPDNPLPSKRTKAEAERYSLFRLGWQSGYAVGFAAGRNAVFVGAIHTQHSMPAIPAAVSPLRTSRLSEILPAFCAPAPPPVTRKPFQTRTLTPLPEEEPIEFFEDDDDAEWLNDVDVTERRKAV
jgi:hypothetical protein